MFANYSLSVHLHTVFPLNIRRINDFVSDIGEYIHFLTTISYFVRVTKGISEHAWLALYSI